MRSKFSRFIETSWLVNKTRFCFIISSTILQIALLVMTIIDYSNLKQTTGLVQELKIERYKREVYVTISLIGNEKFYYQEYIKRFLDKGYFTLKKSDMVSFYTTSKMYHKRMLLFAAGDPFNTKYHPIFNINKEKSFLSVFLFHFYRNSLLAILFYISLAGSFFYTIPYVAVTNWKNRIVVLSIVAIYGYLFY